MVWRWIYAFKYKAAATRHPPAIIKLLGIFLEVLRIDLY